MSTLGDPFLRFFAASLALHLLVLMTWPKPHVTGPSQIPIQVALLPAPEEAPAPFKPTRIPKDRATRPSKSKAIIAQKNSPILEERPIGPKDSFTQREMKREEPPPRKPLKEEIVIAERPLPTMRELLPPLFVSPSELRKNRGEPIPLHTTEPQYITYFTSIRRAIDSKWEYPQLALQYGMQGQLEVEFDVLGNGHLGNLRLVRSSGYHLLDFEALRAIKAASPFAPIPRWIEERPLLLSARMIYEDNRVNFRIGR